MKYQEEIESFGSNLKRLREAANISQQELAYEAEISKRTIQRIEKGQYAATLSVVYAIAFALNIDVIELFETL